MLHSQLQTAGARRSWWASPPVKRLLGHSCPQLPTWQSWRRLLQQVRLRQHQDLEGGCTLAGWLLLRATFCSAEMEACSWTTTVRRAHLTATLKRPHSNDDGDIGVWSLSPVGLACTAGSVEQQRQWLEQEVATESMSYPLREAAQRRQGEVTFAQDDLARQVGARLHEVQHMRAWVCLLIQVVTELGSCLSYFRSERPCHTGGGPTGKALLLRASRTHITSVAQG